MTLEYKTLNRHEIPFKERDKSKYAEIINSLLNVREDTIELDGDYLASFLGIKFNSVPLCINSYLESHGLKEKIKMETRNEGKRIFLIKLNPTHNSFRVVVKESNKDTFNNYGIAMIPKDMMSNFPPIKTKFSLETNIGEIITHMNKSMFFSSMGKWYEKNGKVKADDVLQFQIIEEMKRYKLNLVRDGNIIG